MFIIFEHTVFKSDKTEYIVIYYYKYHEYNTLPQWSQTFPTCGAFLKLRFIHGTLNKINNLFLDKNR